MKLTKYIKCWKNGDHDFELVILDSYFKDDEIVVHANVQCKKCEYIKYRTVAKDKVEK
jgi:hypothetical protein